MPVRSHVRLRALLVVPVLLLLPVMAFASTTGGTPSEAGGVGTLTFEDVTVTVETSTIVGGNDQPGYGVVLAGAPMDQRSEWGGTGDYKLADDPVFTPSDIADGTALMVLWRSNGHAGFCDVTDMEANEVLPCPTPTTVTLTFDREVSGVVLHLQNLGGVATNMDSNGVVFGGRSLYSRWTLTSGQDMRLLSRGGNIQLSGAGTIVETIQPSGTGITDVKEVWKALDLAPQPGRDYFGTGSGSFRVNGSFTTLTFNVDLFLFSPIAATPGVALNAPEGVGLQVSFVSTYLVAFDLGGGTGTTPADFTGLAAGDVSTLPGDSGFSRDGFTFAGWDCDNSIGNVAAGGQITQPAADVLCTARWTPVGASGGAGTYLVAFDLGGGTGTTPADLTGLAAGDVSTLPGDSGFSRDGFSFYGWDCDEGVGSVAAGGQITQPAADVLCTARWTPPPTPRSIPTGEGPPVRLDLLFAVLGAAVLLLLTASRALVPRAVASGHRVVPGVGTPAVRRATEPLLFSGRVVGGEVMTTIPRTADGPREVRDVLRQRSGSEETSPAMPEELGTSRSTSESLPSIPTAAPGELEAPAAPDRPVAMTHPANRAAASARGMTPAAWMIAAGVAALMVSRWTRR
jgi:uncharacterized repeat protein (TIGR02543 family)